MIQGEGMRHAKLLIWMGDFNYRIDDYSYLEVKEQIQRENWDALLEKVGRQGGRAPTQLGTGQLLRVLAFRTWHSQGCWLWQEGEVEQGEGPAWATFGCARFG